MNLSRLIGAVTWFVSEPEGGGQRRLEVCQEDEVTYRPGVITGHGYGGVVRLRYDGADSDEWVDLTKLQYRWLV